MYKKNVNVDDFPKKNVENLADQSLEETEDVNLHDEQSPIIAVLANSETESDFQTNEIIEKTKKSFKMFEDFLAFRVIPKEDLYGIAVISQRDAGRLGLKEREIIVLEDAETKQYNYSIVSTSSKQEDGFILLDQEIISRNNFDNKVIYVRKYEKEVRILTDGVLSIRAFDGDTFTAIADIRNDFYNLKSFLSSYVIYDSAEYRWQEKNVCITLADTLPETSKEYIGIFDFSQPTNLTIKPEGPVQYNAILLMDVSKSMLGRDLEVVNVRKITEEMKSNFQTEKLDHFLRDFKEGNYIKRQSGAAFAALSFLNEKIKRGLDETFSIITFSDDAEVLKVNGKPYINSNIRSKDTMRHLADLIIGSVEDKSGAGTNMASAVEHCIEVIRDFPRQKRKNPLLIILLTDGFDTSMRVKEAVETTFSERNNVVLYSVGIGPYVNRNELNEISKMYGGEVFLPENLGELSEWYRSLARVIPIQIKENIE